MGTVRYAVLDGEIVSENRNGVIRDYVPDPLGSTVALLDNTQTIKDTFTYFPSGTVASRTGTTATPFQFAGTKGYHADASGKTYVRARVLEPAKGRWLTEDPIGFWGGDLNLYRYARGNPLYFIDPSGLTAYDLGACKAACKKLVDEGKLKIGQLSQCEKICRVQKSARNCIGLRTWCDHISNHSGQDPGGSRDFKICTALYEGICRQPWELKGQDVSKFTRKLAGCSSGVGIVICVGLSVCIVACVISGHPEPVVIGCETLQYEVQ